MLIPSRPLDFKRHAYLIGLYECRAREQIVYKASQLGVSEYLVSYALHAADVRKATVLYVFPTDTHVSDFSSARIGPAIEASPYLASIVVEGSAAGGKRGADRVTLKRVRDRFLYFRGAKVGPDGEAPQLKSIDADVLIIDEEDEMDPRAIALADKRLGHSPIAEVRKASTPTYVGFGIHAEWLRSDQREWFVRCEHCGERQPITIRNVVTEFDQLDRPVRWHGNASQAWAACQKCGKPLDRLGPGEWIATQPGVDVAGFHVTKLFSPATVLIDIVKALSTVDETKRKETINQDLAEPYAPRGSQLTDEILDKCRRDYAHGPRHKEATVMGVDVGTLKHVVIRGPADPETGERPQRWAGAVDSFEAVADLMRRYKVMTCVIDALPETTKARELQATFPAGTVYLAYYNQTKIGTKLMEPIDADFANGVVNLDRTRTLDAMFAEFVSGTATLPANAKDMPEYYDHLKAQARVVEDGSNGTKIAHYVQREGKPDHLAHAENYCRVAMHMPKPEQRDTVTVAANVVKADSLFS